MSGTAGPVHRVRERCRACGAPRLRVFLELGPQPLANAFLDDPARFAGEARFPLDLALCEGCGLVQLVDVIAPEILFAEYLYVSGTSDTMNAHFGRYAAELVERLRLGPDDLVLEVASNDGTLLRHVRAHGVRALGVEPAANVAALAREAGVETVNRFFDAALARELRRERGPARAVVANNVLAHVDDTRDFLLGCREALAEDGEVTVEVPYLGDMLARLEYDTVYHEHLCYFSVAALLRLCESAGLRVVAVEHQPVHGGSLRVHAAPGSPRSVRSGGSSGSGDSDGPGEGHAAAVLEWARKEREEGMTELARYQRFAADVRANRAALRGLLERLRGEGASLAAYGAPAKGNTLLNYCGIGTDLVPYTVDKSPLKVGRYTPGTHLPVRPVSALLEERPDYTLILAWNFADEILEQQAAYRKAGGRFIVPIPEPRVMGS